MLTESFYWDLNSRTRAFMERIRPKLGGNYVSSEQAGKIDKDRIDSFADARYLKLFDGVVFANWAAHPTAKR